MASAAMAEAASSPSAETRETESATWVAKSKRRSLAHRLAKKGMEAAPAAWARMAMGAEKSCLAMFIREMAPSVEEAKWVMISYRR